MKQDRLLQSLAAICVLCLGAAAPTPEAKEQGVTLDAPTATRIGIATAPVQAAQIRAEASGFGAVMAFDTLAQTDSDLATAESAVAASAAAVARARGLFSADVSVSRQTVEAAERQAAADAAQLTLAQRKSAAMWGPGAPWRSAAERTQLLTQLSSGDVALARVTFSANSIGDTPPASLRIERADPGPNAATWTATRIWPAPADPTIPGRSFFTLIDRARGLSPGERLRIFVPIGASRQGSVVPSGSVLIAQGKAWYYLAPAPGKYVRQALDLSQPTAQGYFVTDGIAPGQRIVVEGAGLLLAREMGKAEGGD